MNYGFYNYGMPPFGVAPSWDTGFQLPEMPMQPYGPLQSIPQFDTYTFTGGMPIGAQPINTGMFMPTGNTGMSLDMNMLGGWFAFFQNLNMQLQNAMQPPQIQNTPLGNDFYGGGNTTPTDSDTTTEPGNTPDTGAPNAPNTPNNVITISDKKNKDSLTNGEMRQLQSTDDVNVFSLKDAKGTIGTNNQKENTITFDEDIEGSNITVNTDSKDIVKLEGKWDDKKNDDGTITLTKGEGNKKTTITVKGDAKVFVNGDRVNGKTNLFGEPIDDSGSTKAPSKEEEEEFRSQFEGRSATDIKKIDEERFNELEPWQKKIVAEEYAIAYTEEKTGKKNLKFEDLTQEQIDAAMWSAKKDSGGPPTSSTLVDTALSKKVGKLKASESAEATTADELNAQLAEGKVKITEDNIDLVDFDKILSMKDKDKALKIIKNMDLSGLKQNQKDLLAVKFAGAMDNDKAEALGINRDGHDFNDRVSKGDLDKLASILSGMGQPGLGDSLTKIGKNIEEFCKGADQHSWNGGFFWKDNFMEKKAFNSVMLHNRLAGGKTIEELIEDGK